MSLPLQLLTGALLAIALAGALYLPIFRTGALLLAGNDRYVVDTR